MITTAHPSSSAGRYPSKKRDSLYETIQLEFRENKGLTDPAKRDEKISEALYGLKHLQMYDERHLTRGRPGSSSWSVSLDQNAGFPLVSGDGPYKKR